MTIYISWNLPDSIRARIIWGSSGEIRCNNSPKGVTGGTDGGVIRKLFKNKHIFCNEVGRGQTRNGDNLKRVPFQFAET